MPLRRRCGERLAETERRERAGRADDEVAARNVEHRDSLSVREAIGSKKGARQLPPCRSALRLLPRRVPGQEVAGGSRDAMVGGGPARQEIDVMNPEEGPSHVDAAVSAVVML